MARRSLYGYFQSGHKVLGSFAAYGILLLLSSCTTSTSFEPTYYSSPSFIPYLALGDSYTIGENVKSNERWPAQLTSHLRSKGVPLAEPLIIARTGWTTDDLWTSIDQYGPEQTFGLVTLMIGVNNQYRGHDLEEYRADFRKLLKRAIRYADGDSFRVLVFSIPDWGVTPYASSHDRDGISRDIDEFNRVNNEETIRAGAQYIYVTDLSRLADQDTSLLADDGLHPSGKMYSEWVERATPRVLRVLGSRLSQL